MFLCGSGLQNCVGVAATITIIMEHILEVEGMSDLFHLSNKKAN